MSVEQHAEAAARIYKLAEDATDALMLEAGDGVEFWSTAPRILAKHMQAAIDKATATLKARVAALEGLGPLIEEYGLGCKAYGLAIQSLGSDEQYGLRKTRDETKAKIDAILTGGAP